MKLVASALTAIALCLSPVMAAETSTITIPVAEYEKLKELADGDAKKQYWKMSYEQILSKENNNISRAWELYEFWVLRTIYLDRAVNSNSVGKLTEQISTLSKVGNTPITLVIRSGGGGVLEGMQLVNLMRNSAVKINTVCDSYAFSMAAIIFAVGNQRVATEGCVFMLHEVGVGSPGGRSIEHVKWTSDIIGIESQMVEVLMDVSGYDEKEIRTLMEYETFWSGKEAFELGFADEYYVNGKAMAERDIPEHLLPVNRMKENFSRKLNK